MSDSNVFVLDNGAFYAKVGLAEWSKPKIVPNCITKAKSERRRPFVGSQVEECRDVSGLFYILCFQRGYLVNWDIQKTVWDYMFSQECCPVNFAETPLLITEPLFNFQSIQEAMLEILYEEYDCDAVCKTTSVDLIAFNYTHGQKHTKPLCCVVVDMGYSFTHVVPFIKGTKVKEAIRRIDVGGKLLTNHLKLLRKDKCFIDDITDENDDSVSKSARRSTHTIDAPAQIVKKNHTARLLLHYPPIPKHEIISYRQLNVMDESYVLNQVKEDSCFVSQDFNEDMRIARKRYPDNTINREYVLPDYTQIRRGFLRTPDPKNDTQDELQTLRLNNERFVIPEVLFHPSDVGIQQMGVAEAIVDAINSCPDETKPHLFSNIVVCGGSARFSGMQTRIQKDVRAMAPDEFNVNVTVPKDPLSYSWYGGKQYSQSLSFLKSCMSRSQYEENGIKHLVEKYEN